MVTDIVSLIARGELEYSRALSKLRFEIRQTLLLGIPMAGAQLSQLAMTTTDVAFVGRLQGEALAAMAVGQASYAFFLSAGIGLMAAVNPLVSQAYGARQGKEVLGRPVAVGCWCALLYTLVCWFCLWNIDLLFQKMAYEPAVCLSATAYTRAVMLGLPACFVFLCLKNYLDAVSRPRLPFLVSFLGVGVNAVADYALIFGKWGFPQLGVMGTGLATSLVNLFMVLCLLALAWEGDFTRALWRPLRSDIREFLGVGLPIAGSILLEVGFFVAASLLMGKLGSDETAAHQIVMTCASLTFMVPLGLSFAGSTRVGQAVGAGQEARVQVAGLVAIALGVGFMFLSGSVFLAAPGSIVDLFWNPLQTDDRVRGLAIDLLRIAGIFQVFDGLQVTTGGALRGMKDVRIPMLIALASYWLVGLPTSIYLAFHTPLRHRGLWLGLLTGLVCSGLGLLVRFWLLSRRLQDRL